MGMSDPGPRISDDRSALPDVLIFDVYETLSDLSPLDGRFVDVGAPGHLARTWLTTLLLDGLALTAARAQAHFTQLAVGTLRSSLAGSPLNRTVDEAIEHIMGGFDELTVYSDVPEGLSALEALGPRLVTLSNAEASVAERLFARTGLAGHFERHLSTEDAGIWKPAPAAYAYAAGRCSSRPAAMMLVAVHPWDINGAHLAGMRTAWLNRTGSSYPEYFNAPTLQATSLTHLAHLLNS
ncbi:MAG: haloacid dehalogenase type II [Candidatus Nanopelagicales bacterium]